ncbi:MAG: cyclic beta 1-2 glucan synthetase [Polyangiaceae bacterium]|nr:cyclic beta 1-2 glucan synthetase [Polyangiaceae bacterium]
MQRNSEPHSDSQRVVCPGLSIGASWDGVHALRGELYAKDHLVSHAADIARTHGEPSLSSTPGPLRKRFGAARAQIKAAYEILSRDAKNKRDPSPAEEWLLDNSHVVDEQIREIQEDLPWGYLVELPRISVGEMRGYPRVYGLCLDYLRHTDARVDLTSLADYVVAYQRISTLTIGELWAVPIMLRLGLTLIVGSLAVSEARAQDRELADEWADKLIVDGQSDSKLERTLAQLGKLSDAELSAGFLVQLLKRVREHDAPLRPVQEFISARCAQMGTTAEELTRREHLRQAADQVSVGNSITSMRAIAALDWTNFFELTSGVEEVLRQDPCAAYANMDQPSRDRCRHAVEQLARRSKVDERGVAEKALELAKNGAADAESTPAERHVGYYLVDTGRRVLERAIDYRPKFSERLSRPVLDYPAAFYLGVVTIGVGLLCAGAAALLSRQFESPWPVVGLTLIFALPASELVLALWHALIVFVVKPRLLPKLDFEDGIPDEHRTLAVVPSLLESRAGIAQLLEDLEVRALANADRNLYFGLVTDFTDADEAETDRDRELLEVAQAGIAELNRRHDGEQPRYFLFHRRRIENPVEGRFMGWERKRGKLEELNRLLRGDTSTTFAVATAPAELLFSIRYVITLDADTELPREVARRLVGTMAHPQNRPVLDPTHQRVVRGYGILQPRVGTLPLSSRRSRFARIFAGPPGIDPYTTAVSDVYQDLFGEGSFVGKGIYDVDAFMAALHGRVPDNRLLSHDLFESSFARSALVTDIEVLDEQPASYEVVTSREHRWLRGDWQLLPWLLPSVPVRGGGKRASDLRLLDLWKLTDNLRRSLVAPAMVLLLAISWFLSPRMSMWALVVLAGMCLGPILTRQVFSLARAATAPHPELGPLGGALLKNLQETVLGVMVLLDQALMSVDGIFRTLYRLFVSHKNLLEWTTMSQAARRHKRGGSRASRRFTVSAWLAFLGMALVVALARETAPYALPLLLGWLVAPGFIGWLGKLEQEPKPDAEISEAGRRVMRVVARKTWRFFDTFVTAKDNWLPPDNFQEDPRGVVAHRTSPTNIGLYLLSVIAARDLGFITAREGLARLENTLATLGRMERRSGHILNWYDTTNLQPLEPQYVSTVDSGNLAGYLWALREACAELGRMPLFDAQVLEAARDALWLAGASSSKELSELDGRLATAQIGLDESSVEALQVFARLEAALTQLSQGSAAQHSETERRYWLEQAAAVVRHARVQATELAPCLDWLATVPSPLGAHPGFVELVSRIKAARTPAELSGAAAICLELVAAVEPTGSASEVETASAFLQELTSRLAATQRSCEALSVRADKVALASVELADGMDFRFLYDEQRGLFSIGYNVSGARLDGSHYDLLASEARLASLVAISKGDAPLEHWWKLARPRTATTAGRALLSWSGSMFEYLMPLLVTGASRDTLLWETCRSAVGRQQAYGTEQGVPWGISEAAYNVMDLAMNYQYRAFGVPGLGLKSGLAEDLVVAPYATVLSSMIRPDLALANFEALDREGLNGKFGYYEAIDYTPGHVPPDRRSVIVKAMFAHHQGMSLVALCNVLCNWPMQRRFFADARVKASALLLEERVPLSAPNVPVRAEQVASPLLGEPELRLTDHVGPGNTGVERVHLLGHGELSTIITASGAGVTTWKGMDVTRFREDASLDAGGTFVYVRDLTAERIWSAGQQPTGAVPDYYDASFAIDRVELKRRDGAVETVMEIVVSPEHPAEVRRITLSNHGTKAVDLDITSYSEPVLAVRGADVAHRAFSSMFLETELLPEHGAILVRRRPRSSHEAESWLVQVLTPDGEGFGPAELDSSRAEFLGRGGSLQKPQGLRFGHQLTRTAGNVLDPGLALRRAVTLAPGQRARLTLTTGLATSREAALELLELVMTPHSSNRAFELAWADARVELKHLGITAARSHRFQRLLSCVMFAPPALRESAEAPMPLTRGKNALWSQGISGDLPILLLCIDSADFGELTSELLLAHEFWRLNGVTCDLVILNDEPEGYMQPLQMALEDLIRSSPAQGHENQPGGIFLRRSGQLSLEERVLVRRAARVVLKASAGSLSQQLRKAAEPLNLPERLPVVRRRAPSGLTAPAPAKDLRHFNGIGGFSADGREYVMSIGPGARPPAPWCNVLSNQTFGSVVSESGLGFTWFGNSQRERISPWSNDAVSDASGEIVYLRDREDGSSWSATPEPASGGAHFTVRHGQGYTVYSHVQGELEHELTVFVSPTEPVKLLRLRLKNCGARARRLAIYSVVEWVLGPSREATRLQVCSTYDAAHGVLYANNPFVGNPEARAFVTTSLPVVSVTGDRQEFFGVQGTRARPAALERTKLSGRTGVGLDPCGALQVSLDLEPGQSRDLCVVIGHAASQALAAELALRFKDEAQVQKAFEAVAPVWDDILSITAQTPDDSFDLMVNRWLLYQAVGARLWARSGFYQSSGAYGYRDQLQDVLALVHARPDLAREHILRAAARQFKEGDVQHWWHPESGEGVRTHCSDDLLFLPYAVASYVRATGDTALLDEQAPFLEERELKRDEDDLFASPRQTTETASIYEHCVRALTRGTTAGANGIPLMGTGDWNDGMNRVGKDGIGESVWLGWFLVRTLKDFEPIAQARDDQARAETCRREAERVIKAIDVHSWDGAWYHRAYYDDGTPIGSHNNQDCRIDAIAQSWSVIAGGDPARSRQALESSLNELVQEDDRLMRLLVPPFTHLEHDPGYIRSYPDGVRENGGQYTHGVLWTVQALCLLGEGERAHHLFSLLNPVSHATTPAEVKRYRVEPYVLAADVYASPEHMGRGGWTWYTGSASWMFRIGVEHILGLQRRGQELNIAPCVPPSWTQFQVRYRYGKSELVIQFQNPKGVPTGVQRIALDGRELEGANVPLVDDGRRHEVTVVMGQAADSAARLQTGVTPRLASSAE